MVDYVRYLSRHGTVHFNDFCGYLFPQRSAARMNEAYLQGQDFLDSVSFSLMF